MEVTARLVEGMRTTRGGGMERQLEVKGKEVRGWKRRVRTQAGKADIKWVKKKRNQRKRTEECSQLQKTFR